MLLEEQHKLTWKILDERITFFTCRDKLYTSKEQLNEVECIRHLKALYIDRYNLNKDV